MRRITFTELGMENYGPYTEPFVLECPDDSLTLITGPNGVGKTISLDSMSFTFFGITSKGERGDDVVNNTVGKNCHTWVKFNVSDGDSYVVDRYHKHSKFKNTARITRNGEDKPYKVGHREVTAEIERLVCDRRTFTNTLMFGQKVKDFFTDLKDTEQKAIFWKLLDLLKYTHYKDTAKNELKKEEDAISKVEQDINVAKGILETIDGQIDDENKKAAAFEIDRERMINTLKDSIVEVEKLVDIVNQSLDQTPDEDLKPLQENAFSIKSKLENVGKDAEAIKKDVETEAYQKVNELTETRNQKQQEINNRYKELNEALEQTMKKLDNDFHEKNDALKEEQKQLEISASEHKATIQSNNARIGELEITDLEVGSECPTCLEAITEKSITNIQKIIEDMKSENGKHMKALSVIQEKYDKLEEDKSKLFADRKNEVAEGQKRKSENKENEREELQEIDDRLAEVKQQIADLANNTLKERIKDLELNAQKMQKELTEAEAALSVAEQTQKKRQELELKLKEYTTKIEEHNNQIKATEEKEFDDTTLQNLTNTKHQKLEVVQRAESEISSAKAEIERLKFWQEGYSQRGIPSMLIDQAVPLMNASMRKYLDTLSNGRYIVTFDTISQTKGGDYRDKFSVNVLDTKTQVNNRKQLSGGQTRLIDIATILTLRDLKAELGEVEFNLFAFDEIFDALDDSNIGYVCGILNSLKESRSLLIVSHRHQNDLEADSHIQLT